MAIRIEFATGNDWFREYTDDSMENSVLDRSLAARTINEVASMVYNGKTEGRIFDGNGNSVGSFVVDEDN